MTFKEYEAASEHTAHYPRDKYLLVYPALGLAGEAGEAVEKVKKAIRKGGLEHLDRDGLIKELGDVLWYLASMAHDIGTSLDEIAEINIAKLSDRAARDVIKSEGDNR